MIGRFCDYEEVVDCGPDGVSVAEVTFKMDFGPWKKGEKINALALDGDKLVEWTFDGKALRSCLVKLVPA